MHPDLQKGRRLSAFLSLCVSGTLLQGCLLPSSCPENCNFAMSGTHEGRFSHFCLPSDIEILILCLVLVLAASLGSIRFAERDRERALVKWKRIRSWAETCSVIEHALYSGFGVFVVFYFGTVLYVEASVQYKLDGTSYNWAFMGKRCGWTVSSP